MNNSAAKVGEIFTEAGAAFNKLAEMTMMLHPMAENPSSGQAKTPVKRKAAEDRPGLMVNTPQAAHNVHTAPISQQESVQLADGLTLVKQADAPAAVAEPRFFPGMSTEDKLDMALRTKFEQLMNSHTISMDLASEGRGRGKKVLPYLLLGIFTTVSVVGGIALKTLAAIAGKALIASKVALTIAGIIALKKLFSHDGAPGETTFQVHADGHHSL